MIRSAATSAESTEEDVDAFLSVVAVLPPFVMVILKSLPSVAPLALRFPVASVLAMGVTPALAIRSRILGTKIANRIKSNRIPASTAEKTMPTIAPAVRGS